MGKLGFFFFLRKRHKPQHLHHVKVSPWGERERERDRQTETETETERQTERELGDPQKMNIFSKWQLVHWRSVKKKIKLLQQKLLEQKNSSARKNLPADLIKRILLQLSKTSHCPVHKQHDFDVSIPKEVSHPSQWTNMASEGNPWRRWRTLTRGTANRWNTRAFWGRSEVGYRRKDRN